ncbi:MAG: aminotransferase class IV [Geminicoccaceae bacterium]|nr:aminotransferase class IV [Geminicoccaceae bacterium]MDW8444057.1 aminotransferase class IV [Acetobacteraceae bacterium]MCS7268160.1 aminotransferase class IV [Geminicoccaceae bacterium]MCX7629602.1 aminotransferase class IV [Geminicoccaceae bacterium]MDW8125375.1 aminotransferase class IV [Geminicoccaceae bacterium]
MIVWHQGALRPVEATRIDPTDRGLALADGLFETMKARDGRILRLERHWLRLAEGAKLLGIPLPLDETGLAAAARELLLANGFARGEAALRLTLTRGPAPRGLLPPERPTPTVLLTAFPLPEAPPPARAVLVKSVRRNEHSPTSRIKSLAYLDQILALREAIAAGGDEALLCNTAGRLACASAANLFLVVDGRIWTPAPSEGALPGVTRAVLLERARARGLLVVEAELPRHLLARAQEAFTTNALSGLRPIASVDGFAFPEPCPGPITRRLAELLEAE